MNAERWEIDNDGYHLDREYLSHSALDCFGKSEALYWGRYVTGIYPMERTREMEIGSIFHSMVLEGIMPAIAPDVDRRTRQGKLDWAAFLTRANGKAVVDSDEWSMLSEMRAAIRENPAAESLLVEQPGETEIALRWLDPFTGAKCKLRADKILDGRPAVIDLKTAGEVSEATFAKTAYKYGYHRQAAWYLDGLQTFEPGELIDFVFVVVQKSVPFTTGAFTLDDDFIELGREQNRQWLQRLLQCRERNEWHGPTFGQIVRLSAPRYAFYESEYTVEG